MLQGWIYFYTDACISNNFIFISFIIVNNYHKVKRPKRVRLQKASEGLSIPKSLRSTAKIVLEWHLLARCEHGLKYVFQNCVNKNVKKHINEYIIFCKNQNFRDKNNKTIIIMNSTTRSQSNWAIPEKTNKQGVGWRYGLFRGLKDTACEICGISRS